jgi:alpha-glucoside transport system permease protein
MNIINSIGALIFILGLPIVFILYMLISEKLANKKGGSRKKRNLLPWLWLIPALLLIFVFLIYPLVNTVILSFMDAKSQSFVGTDNYEFMFTSDDMLSALKNNLLWIIFFTLITVTLGLVLAVLTDRVRYEAVAKSLIFLPACISFVAAGVIWKFMYAFKPKGEVQIGTLNAIFTALIPGFEPQAWLFNPDINNWALIIVGIWIWTGFALVIFSAGLKGIPQELLEAARIDGAGEISIFFKIILPLMKPTLTMVTTYFIITVLKIFDIVYVMTNGNLGTEVIANRMYKEMFTFRNYGHASAIAIILLVAIIPVMIMNIKRFKRAKL